MAAPSATTWGEVLEAAYKEMEGLKDPLGAVDRYEEMVATERPTSGVEDVVDWEELEIRLDIGWFDSKQEVKEYVRSLYKFGGRDFHETNTMPREVLGGLFPEYREKYQALPNRVSKQKGAQ